MCKAFGLGAKTSEKSILADLPRRQNDLADEQAKAIGRSSVEGRRSKLSMLLRKALRAKQERILVRKAAHRPPVFECTHSEAAREAEVAVLAPFPL